MNPTRFLALTAFLAVLSTTTTVMAQTVYVTKLTMNPGTFTTLQSALDHFENDPDPNTPNVIMIANNGVYDEVVTIKSPVSIQGSGGASEKTTIALQGNPQTTGANSAVINLGLAVVLPSTYSTGTVELKNLNLIPSRTNTPTGQGIRTIGTNMFLHLDNVTLTANDGNDNPVTADGRTAADLSNAVFFGDDGMFLGSTAGGGHAGEGFEALFRNTVISHNRGATTPDGIVVSNNTAVPLSLTLGDGCVISYNGRHGLQASRNFRIDAPINPVLISNNTRGIWFVGDSPDYRVINGLHCIGNSSYGIFSESPTLSTKLHLKRSLVINNGENAVVINNAVQGVDISNTTIIPGPAKQPLVIQSAVAGPVQIWSSIIGGTGDTGNPANAYTYSGSGGLTFDGVGLITAGPYALASSLNSGSGTVSGSTIIEDDPDFFNTSDFNLPGYFDVQAASYGNAAAGGSALGGGAKFVGTSGVSSWTLY